MRSARDRFTYEYGAQPLHLLAVVASLLLCGYGLLRIENLDNSLRIVVWIVACALFHDVIALPLYSALLRIARIPAGAALKTRAMTVHAYNHIRVPVGFSLVLLLVYLPLILRLAPDEYMGTTGRSVDVYLGRWLLLSAAGFLVSAIAYAITLRRGVPVPDASRPPASSEPGEAPPVGRGWRIGSRIVLAMTGLAVLWVAAALVVGLLTTGFSP
ncbi:MAG: hypothetical protein KDB58_04030 [Solirubrobacterales bacterium]|nr:hypothetical protein [Solirubrobacterales bacterium]MCB8969693.1 hypothetical protein [Thermoleophilales bacterium]MCO5327213.1 hypothetical protein [Solirubrobacterales bacterium]